MKNNKVKGILIAVLALTIAVGATLAYLANMTESKTNKFTFVGGPDNDIKGEIKEDWDEDDGLGVLPGEEIKKIVTFKNISSDSLSDESATVWGAVKVIFELEQASGDPIPATEAQMALINQIMSLDYNTTDWEAVTTSNNNIIFVHRNTLARGEESNSLFTTVTIEPGVDRALLDQLAAIAPKGVNIRLEGAVLQHVGVNYTDAVDILIAELNK